jgi:hypothetical protein
MTPQVILNSGKVIRARLDYAIWKHDVFITARI